MIVVTNFLLQLYAGQIILQHDHVMAVRSFAKEASPSNLPPLKGDGEIITVVLLLTLPLSFSGLLCG